MKIYFLCNSKLKTHLNKISGKNSLKNKLIRLIYKFAKSVTKINNKVYEPKTYNKVINDPIEVIDKKLQNLDIYQTQSYTLLLDNQKTISYKQVLKVKYNFNNFIERYKVKFVIQEFFQIYGIKYIKIFIPIIKYELLKIFLTIAIILEVTFI